MIIEFDADITQTGVPISQVKPGDVFENGLRTGRFYLRLSDDLEWTDIKLNNEEEFSFIAMRLADFVVDAWSDDTMDKCFVMNSHLRVHNPYADKQEPQR